MWCACGDKKRISRMHRIGNEEVFQSVSSKRLQKGFPGHARSQPNQNLCARFGMNRMPHFGFAAAACGLFVSGGVSIVRMNLDGKLVLGENELD